jgi:hypothetical protein
MKKRTYIFALSCLMALIGVGTVFIFKGFWNNQINTVLPKLPIKKKQPAKPKSQPWMTVFVHGSFGCVVGLVSIFNVLQDDVKGSTYHKITKRMRKDPFFYKDQPILERGLIRIKPTYDITLTGGKKYAAYPLLKAYENILEYVRPNKEEHYFYTFGWSGLLSQKARRIESIRFYNVLCAELERFERVGIHPKIRIIGHSHAGNLMLNLGLVHEALNKEKFESNYPDDQYKRQTFQLMKKTLHDLPARKITQQKKGQKKWDYMPVKNDLIIDEMIMYGCPIQPETDHCALLGAFKTVYNFYSKEDIVQKLDWVSTKNSASSQRFDKKFMQVAGNAATTYPRIIQAQVMVGRNFTKKDNPKTTKTEQQPEKDDDEPLPFWKKLLSSAGLLPKRVTKDPNHKELWFFSWKKNSDDSTLHPVPAFVLTPVFTHAIQAQPQLNDIDLNILVEKEKIRVVALQHKKTEQKYEISFPTTLFETIKSKLLAWKPEDEGYETELQIINRYSTDNAK